jgi:hypothetical protein
VAEVAVRIFLAEPEQLVQEVPAAVVMAELMEQAQLLAQLILAVAVVAVGITAMEQDGLLLLAALA